MPRGRRQQDTTRLQPLTLAALGEHGAFEDFAAPGSLDPEGQWAHTYRIWLVGRRRQGEASSLRVARSAPADGTVTLSVAVSITQSAGTTHETKAKIECRTDALCAPLSWQMSSVVIDAEGQPIEDSKIEQLAVVGSNGVEVTIGDSVSVRKVPEPFTSNWSLFEAVQRLAGPATKPLTFTLLEDLDLVKENQRLSFRESVEFDFGGGPVRLQGYQQIGAGILPCHYWVDEHHRLLVALSGIRAYILDTTAQERQG